MHLKQLSVQNFRNIEDIEINFPDGKPTILVGQNAIGKSTILNAIRFLFVVIAPRVGNEVPTLGRDLGILAPDNRNLLINELQGATDRQLGIRAVISIQGEFEHLRDSTRDVAIYKIAGTRRFQNDTELELYIQTREGQDLLQRECELIEQYLAGASATKCVTAALHLPASSGNSPQMDPCASAVINYLMRSVANPQVSRVTAFSADRAMQAGWGTVNLAEGRSIQTYESHLAAPQHKYQKIKDFLVTQYLVNPTQLREDISGIFNDLLKEKEFRGLQADNNGRIRALVRDRNGREYDIDNMSSGEKSVVLSFFMALRTTMRNGICLFDEPELHLSPEACRKIIPFFRQRMAQENGIQVIACTHSPDVLGDAYEDSMCHLVHIASPRRAESVARRPSLAIEALKSLGLTTDEFIYSKGAIVVEGFDDVRLLGDGFRELAELRGMRFLSVGGIENMRTQIRALQAQPDLDGLFVFLHDSDGGMSTLPPPTANVRVVKWSRYDIESYLLDADVICDVLKENRSPIDPKSPGSIREELREFQVSSLRKLAISRVLQQYLPAFVNEKHVSSAENYQDAACRAISELSDLQAKVSQMPVIDGKQFADECCSKFSELNQIEMNSPFSIVKGKAAVEHIKRLHKVPLDDQSFKSKLMIRNKLEGSEPWIAMRNELLNAILPSD